MQYKNVRAMKIIYFSELFSFSSQKMKGSKTPRNPYSKHSSSDTITNIVITAKIVIARKNLSSFANLNDDLLIISKVNISKIERAKVNKIFGFKVLNIK